MLSRRDFLKSTASAISLSTTGPEICGASIHDSSNNSNSQVIVNFSGADPSFYAGAYLNQAKLWNPYSSQQAWPALLTGANNYPNGKFTVTAKGLVYPDPAYYGRYVLSWSVSGGTGGIGNIGANPVIVYSGANSCTVFEISPSASGEVSGNMAVQSGATGANIEFAYGVLIGAVSISRARDAGGAGLVKFSTANSGRAGNFSTGMTFKFFNVVSGLPASGPNADGSWTINAVDTNNFSLQGSSSYAGSVIIVARGGPASQTQGIYSVYSDNPGLFGDFTGSNFSNLIWCKRTDLADIEAGKLATQSIVSAFDGTNAAYIRFMDICQVQNVQGPDYAHRVAPLSFNWGNIYNPIAYWGGVMTNSGDTFTCPTNPSASPASGGYVDGEVVIAQVGASGHNTTQNPRMGITGRTGTAPIYNAACSLINLTLTGSVPPSGTTLSFVFTGGGLASPFTYNYLASTTVNGPAGVPDTSLTNIIFNIRADLQNNTRGNAGPLLAAGIYCLNGSFPDGSSQASFYYNQNINSSGAAQLGAGMSISGSDPSDNITFTFGLTPVAYFADGVICAFTYSALLQGWIGAPGTNNGGATQGGVRGGPPLEFLAELCARANAGAWFNVGVLDSATTIYDTVFNLARATYNGQPAVKSLALEFGNETWNNQLGLFGPCQAIAAALGFSVTTGGSNYSSHALRTLQMAQQATAAWAAAGRSRSQLKIVNAYQFVNLNVSGTSDTSVFRFNGSALNASGTGTNVTLKAYGGLGQTSLSTDFSSAPNRPIDWCDWISPATYWEGGQYNATGHGLTGSPLSAYNGSLLAAFNFAYGNPAEQQAALNFLYNVSANTGDLYNGTFNGSPRSDPIQISGWALGSASSYAGYLGVGTIAASYDASRSTTGTGRGSQLKLGVACYEGGWEMGPVYGSQLASSLSGLGYTANYSASLPGAVPLPAGVADDAAHASLNLYNLLVAWKNDTRARALVARQFNEFKAAVNFVSTRDAYPSWYGFQGSTIWAMYPGLITQSAPFKAYDAVAAFR